jgi:hypothetical protein
LDQLRKLTLLVKEIGIPNLASYAVYQLKLRSGWLRRRTPEGGFTARREIALEAPLNLTAWSTNWRSTAWTEFSTLLSKESAFLIDEKYRPFIGDAVEQLNFSLIPSLDHWTAYSNDFEGKDIKFTWEPARFTWSLALGRAYKITGDERYAQLFWRKFDEFQTANPVNRGPNWASAQEVALRMIMWILVIPALVDSPTTTPERLSNLAGAALHHIERILPTLSYARSQDNNHVLSEALGLIVGGNFLRRYDPRAESWISRGTREFDHAILRQVDEEGNYSQHSANYLRMMLQLALMYNAFLEQTSREMPAGVRAKLALAARWLIAQMDVTSGRLPNLGHNDGTLLLPFGGVDFRDYRPTAQAAAIAFLGHPCLPTGPWDELTSWLGLQSNQTVTLAQTVSSPGVRKVGTADCWASLRAVRFHNRPAHADQLQVEIWCDGENLARDAGTYLYNAPLPWQNALDVTRAHNTVTIDGKDQMQRVSRFLWLDQAQARWLVSEEPDTIIAEHNGYRNLGITHQRSVKFDSPASFVVVDTLTPTPSDQGAHEYRLHWLLPDWQWGLEGQRLTLSSERMKTTQHIQAVRQSNSEALYPIDVSLIRAGKTLTGHLSDEILGWESNTYNEKHPALSLSVSFQVSGAAIITTEWKITRA